MASTATTRLRLEKQGTGENNNSWGTKLNTTGLDLIDAAIMGVTSYTLSGSKTLTANNYAADEARMPVQYISGGTGGTVTVPSAQGKWFFYNGSSGAVTVTTGGGTTVELASGDSTWVFTDGTDCYKGLTKAYVDAAIASASLGGLSNLPANQGGTGFTSYAVGDMLYAATTSTLAKLAAVATGNVLISGGTSTAPSWGKVGLTTHVSGTLPVANGGTGVTTSTGSGANVHATSPTISSPTITGTISAATITTLTAGTIIEAVNLSGVAIQSGGSTRLNIAWNVVTVQNAGLRCSLGTSGGGMGYASGASAAVTQGTSRTTGVTCDRVSGKITLVSAAGSTTPATFTVSNSACFAADTPIVAQRSGTDKYIINVTNVQDGSFDITFYTTGGTTTEQPVFSFNIIRGGQ